MKILMLTTHLDTGGVTEYVLNLSSGLSELGHEVIIASSGGNCLDKLKSTNIRHIQLAIRTKSMLAPKLYTNLFALLSETKPYPDIIHAHTRVTQVMACLYAKFAKCKMLTTCHGFFRPKLSRNIFKCWGHKTIAISEAVQDHLVNDLKINKQNIHVVYNGIKLDKYQIDNDYIKNTKKEFKVLDNFTIGIVARLSSVKGHKYLFRAFKNILSDYPDHKLMVFGDGDKKQSLLDLAKELNISDNVMFFHQTKPIKQAYACLDLFVMPSIHEGLGLAIIEAMACGVPVIASNVGGIPSIIRDKENGLLVPAKDINALTRAIKSMIQNPDLQKRFSAKGLETVKEKFTLEEMVKNTESIYRLIL